MAQMDDRDHEDEHNPDAAPAQKNARSKPANEPVDGRPADAVYGAARSNNRAPLSAPDTGSLIALNRRQPPVPISNAPSAPDAMEPDRILELPTRRSVARHEPVHEPVREPEATVQTSEPDAARRALAPTATTADPERRVRQFPTERRAGGMASLREAAQPYLAHLAAKRKTSSTGAPDESDQADTRGASRSGRATKPLDPPESDACPLCHGAGFVRLDVPVGDKLFGQAVRCECKEREIEERERQKLRDLSSLKPFEKKTFATFETGIQGVAEAFEVARRYAEDPNGWLVLQGGYGCGKTHLAAAIAHVREAASETVFFSIAPDLLDHLRATFAPTSEITYDDLFDRVRHVGLLVMDDLGSENSTAWATEKLFQIINYRYNYRLPTVITTNIRLLSHLDDRIRSRLGDIGLVRWVVMNAPDYRERHAGPAGPSDGGRPSRGTRGRSYGR